jgi:hypothetical protein
MTTQAPDKFKNGQTAVLVDITIESTLSELQGNHVIIERQSSPTKRRQFIATVRKENGKELHFTRLDYFPHIISAIIGELLNCPVSIKLHDIGQQREGYHAVVTATSSLHGEDEHRSESVDKLGCVAMTKAAIKATEALFANKN